MHERPGESLGVVAANQEQAEYVRAEIDRLAAQDPVAAGYIRRSEEGLEEFFVKNLENVQGDERDVIIISIGYGPTPGRPRDA